MSSGNTAYSVGEVGMFIQTAALNDPDNFFQERYSTSPSPSKPPSMDIVAPGWVRKVQERDNRSCGLAHLAPKWLPLEQTKGFRALDLGPPALKIPKEGFQDPGGKRLFRAPRTFGVPVPAQSFGDVRTPLGSPSSSAHLLAVPLVPGRKSKVGYFCLSPASKLNYGKRAPSRTPSPLLTTSPWAVDWLSPGLLSRPWSRGLTPGAAMAERFMQLQDCEWYDVLKEAPFPLPRRDPPWKSPIRCSNIHRSPARRSRSRKGPRRSLRLKELADRKIQDAPSSGA